MAWSCLVQGVLRRSNLNWLAISIDPWAQCPSLSTTRITNCLHSVLDCARMLAECTSIWHHSLMSSSHSLFGFLRIPYQSPMPNTTCFISLELFIRHMCPNKCSFLSITIWGTFRWHFTLLLTSSSVIICCHLTFLLTISGLIFAVLCFDHSWNLLALQGRLVIALRLLGAYRVPR